MEKARAEAIIQLKTANHIMLCADCTDFHAAADFVQYLPTALMETGADRLACDKLVICLTKADKYVVDHPGIATRDEFHFEDPLQRAIQVISRVGINTLRFYLPDSAHIRAGWASVYGFEPKSGLPNYDPDNESLLIDASIEATPADILDRWRPYQIIDPFVFLTMGDAMGLKVIPPLGSSVPGMQQPELVTRLLTPMERVRTFFKPAWHWVRIVYNYLR
jgi:hypothetical protein